MAATPERMPTLRTLDVKMGALQQALNANTAVTLKTRDEVGQLHTCVGQLREVVLGRDGLMQRTARVEHWYQRLGRASGRYAAIGTIAGIVAEIVRALMRGH